MHLLPLSRHLARAYNFSTLIDGAASAVLVGVMLACAPTQAQDPPEFRPPQFFCVRDVGGNCVAFPLGIAVADVIGVSSSPPYTPTAPDGWQDVIVVNNEPTTGVEQIVIFANTRAWPPVYDPAASLVKVLTIDLPAGPTFAPDPYEVEAVDLSVPGEPSYGFRDIVFSAAVHPESTLSGPGSCPTQFVPSIGCAMGRIMNNGDGTFTYNFQPFNPNSTYHANGFQLPVQVTTPVNGSLLAVGLNAGDLDNQPGKDVALCGRWQYDIFEICVEETRVSVFLRTNQFQFFDVYGFSPLDQNKFDYPTEIALGRYTPSTPQQRTPEIAVGSRRDPSLFMIWRDAQGLWQSATQENVSVPTAGLASGKFGTSSVVDLAMPELSIAPNVGDETYRTLNDGSGGFGAPPAGFQMATLRNPYGAATGLLNDDLTTDIVVACQSGIGSLPNGGVAVFLGNPAQPGSFITPTPYEFNVDPGASPRPLFVKAADMNLDGRRDLIVSCTGSGKISVLLNALPPEP